MIANTLIFKYWQFLCVFKKDNFRKIKRNYLVELGMYCNFAVG